MKVAKAVILLCFFSIVGWAQEESTNPVTPDPESTAAVIPSSVNPPAPLLPQTPQTPSPYTRAYEIRQDIHKYASYATLPLFAAEYALGESLGSEPGSEGSARGLHAALGTGLVALFFVETATGGWNLWQSRHEKQRRTPRMIHSFLMIAANVGFVATAASTPSEHRPTTFDHDRNTHRNIAIASIGIGTAGYLLSVFARLH
jgi:hypothetical protein